MAASDFENIRQTFEQHVIGNYPRGPIAFERGQGSHLWDTEGNRYLDLIPGLGTTTIGYTHPTVRDAICDQAGRLLHIDNLFYTRPQGELARELSHRAFDSKWFFCNSGTEATEAAIKLARLHGDKTDRHKIVAMENSFHGRTFAAISATGQAKYHTGYVPLVPGFEHVPFNDVDALSEAVDDDTCAVMLEPVQGEGGVYPADESYLHSAQQLCNEREVLLVLDEVQTGMGRTGEWFAYQNYDLEPDIMALAKALGGGMPIGAMGARPEVAESLKPGTHASTFGGNPLACRAGLAVIEAIEEGDLLEQGRQLAGTLADRLDDMADEYSVVKEHRGLGLMRGLELNEPGGAVADYCLDNGVRINCTSDTVVRMLPCMNLPQRELRKGLDVMEEGIARLQRGDI